MANGDSGATLGAAALAFLKGKALSLIWMLALSAASVFGGYKVFAYRIDQNATDIRQLRSEAALRTEEDRKQQEVLNLLGAMREQMRAESDDRKQNDALLLQEVRHANERIDRLLQPRALTK